MNGQRLLAQQEKKKRESSMDNLVNLVTVAATLRSLKGDGSKLNKEVSVAQKENLSVNLHRRRRPAFSHVLVVYFVSS